MTKTLPALFATTLFVGLTTSADASDITFESTDRQTRVIELYTSEGCSSCPPADRWLTSLREDDGLWRDFVPLAFHVTYWNYLGWRDAFSDDQFDQRQRRRASLADSGVYTPGVFVDGQEYRTWRARRSSPGSIDGLEAGRLKISVADGRVEAQYNAARPTDGLRLEFALLSSGLTSKVRAGENRGRSLEHDFVVAKLSQHALVKDEGSWHASFPAPVLDNVSQPAIAAWVVDKQGNPLQATGGWLTSQ